MAEIGVSKICHQDGLEWKPTTDTEARCLLGATPVEFEELFLPFRGQKASFLTCGTHLAWPDGTCITCGHCAGHLVGLLMK